jgi:hypothetical protein
MRKIETILNTLYRPTFERSSGTTNISIDKKLYKRKELLVLNSWVG